MVMHAGSLIERQAHHESGHCVGAMVFGMKLIGVTITTNPRMEHGECEYWRRAPRLAVEALGCIALCGAAAEKEIFGNVTDGSDGRDVRIARELLEQQGHGPLTIGLAFERLRTSAQRLVAQERYRVELIAGVIPAQKAARPQHRPIHHA